MSNKHSIYIGQTFESWNSFAAFYEDFVIATKSSLFIIRDSKTVATYNKKLKNSPIPDCAYYAYVVFECVHGKRRDSRSKGERIHQRIIKSNCSSILFIAYNIVLGVFEIKYYNNAHLNHEGELAHPREGFDRYSANKGFRKVEHLIPRVIQIGNIYKISKVINDDHIKSVTILINADTPSQSIKKVLKCKDLNVTKRQLTNFKHTQMDFPKTSGIDEFLKDLDHDQMNDTEMIVKKKFSDSGLLEVVYIQFSWMKVFFDYYPEHILVDATYSLNALKMPLYIILCVDGMGFSIPVAFGLVANETKKVVTSFIEIFMQNNPSSVHIQSYITDKDLTEINVLKNFLPNAKHQLCAFHVETSFKNMVNSSKYELSLDEKEEARTLLRNMLYTSQIDKYDEYLSKFSESFAGSQILLDFLNRWDSCKSLWRQVERCKIFNLGDKTNNRIESINQKLKKVIPLNSKLNIFYLNLKLFLNDIKEKITTAAFDMEYKKLFLARSHIPDDVIETMDRHCTYYATKKIENNIEAGLEIIDEAEKKNREIFEKCGNFYVFENRKEVSLDACTCAVFINNKFPCRHMMALKIHLDNPLFDPNTLPLRWAKSYYLKAVNASKIRGKSILNKNHVSDNEMIAKTVVHSVYQDLVNSSGESFLKKVGAINDLLSSWSSEREEKTITEKPATLENIAAKTNSLAASVSIALPEKAKGRPKGSVLTVIGKVRQLPKPSITRKDYHKRELQNRPLNVPIKRCRTAVDNEVISMLSGTAWLSDEIISKAQNLIADAHPAVNIQNPLFLSLDPPCYKPCGEFIQIINSSPKTKGSHWLCVQGIDTEKSLNVHVYDSMPLEGTLTAVISLASSMFRYNTTVKTLTIFQYDIPKQQNGYDCGLYAIAYAKTLAMNKDPCKNFYTESMLRQHLLKSFKENNLTEFPHSSRNSPGSPKVLLHLRVYCKCRMVENDENLFECSTCLEKFHLKCDPTPAALKKCARCLNETITID